jgi:hypothetical protein
MFFIPEISNKLINQIFQSHLPQRYSNFVNVRRLPIPERKKRIRIPFQPEYVYLYAFQYIFRMKRILYLVLILVAANACKEVFEAPPQALLKATLLNSTTKTSISTKVTVRGIGIDSILYNDTTLTELILPLSANNESSFLVSFDSISDTITFTHKDTLEYGSMETGFYNEYKLQNIKFTKNRIDSILITDSLVTKTWHENIKLYIHP